MRPQVRREQRGVGACGHPRGDRDWRGAVGCINAAHGDSVVPSRVSHWMIMLAMPIIIPCALHSVLHASFAMPGGCFSLFFSAVRFFCALRKYANDPCGAPGTRLPITRLNSAHRATSGRSSRSLARTRAALAPPARGRRQRVRWLTASVTLAFPGTAGRTARARCKGLSRGAAAAGLTAAQTVRPMGAWWRCG